MSAQASSVQPYDLHSSGFFANPEGTLSRMRENDPVYYDKRLGAWVITRYDDVAEVLRSPNFSVDRNGEIGRNGSALLAEQLESVNKKVREFMVFSDPPRHTRLRAAVSKAFQPQALRTLEPLVEEFAHGLLDDLAGSASFDVLHDYGEPLAEEVTAYMLGLPPEDAAELKGWTLDLFGLVGAANVADDVVRSNAQGMEAFEAYIGKIVASRRRSTRTDLTSQLVREVSGEFSESEIVSLIITLIAGAYETTSHLISSGVYALLRHPEQLGLLRRNPLKIASAVEEFLRFCGPAFAVQRRALSDTSIRGQEVRERERVYCMLHAANHDPAVFAAPETLDIERSPCRHVGLGLGAHFCLGAWLTRMETQVAINTLLARCPSLVLTSDAEPKWAANFAIRGLQELEVSRASLHPTIPAPSRTRMKVLDS